MTPHRFPVAPAILLACFLVTTACSLERDRAASPTSTAPPPALEGTGAGSGTGNQPVTSRKLMVSLEIENLRDPVAIDAISRRFDAFLYGHPLIAEDAVAQLRAAGLEDWRYFNAFSVDVRYDRWHGFYRQLYARLVDYDGLVPDVHFRWFGSPEGPDRIIDHTRTEISKATCEVIACWADSIDAKHVFLDLTFDTPRDWMILDGESWPWPADEMPARRAAWRDNMQTLIDCAGNGRPVCINGTYLLEAPYVFFENQPLVHRRGQYTWQELIERALAGSMVPILHVGHQHLYEEAETVEAEDVTAAVWLLLDEAYLRVEYEPEPLAYVRELDRRGWTRFEAADRPVEVEPGHWRRAGTIDGERHEVVVDAIAGRGWVRPLTP
ncbi:MAG: hypothetical protein PVF43_16635 [Candidatus Eiseniibacteriota bacterium]|jgi:hypothetical protein